MEVYSTPFQGRENAMAELWKPSNVMAAMECNNPPSGG